MRWIVATAVALLLIGGPAEARRHHRHHHNYYPAELSDQAAFPLPDRPRYRTGLRNTRSTTVASLVPTGWKEESTNGSWDGKRYLSPDGNSWIAIYRVSADTEQPSDHLKEVIFASGETITYLRGTRSWVAVSGFKSDRIFYRKAVSACAGKEWHHVAFEYPIELHEKLDGLVNSAADALDNTEADCSQPLASQ